MTQSHRLTVSNSTSILGFDTPKHKPGFDRYLTIEGKRAYHIGNICNTCEFLFERLEGANQNISAAAIAEQLNTGKEVDDSAFVEALSQVLPPGDYVASFLNVQPRLITPGNGEDYFVAEQIDLWGIEAFWGLPHHPHVMYYRGRSIPLGHKRQLFEFVIPMFPYTWLDPKRTAFYENEIATGNRPTAFALSILDVKQPAMWDGEPAVTEHWCLAHYLLDGHHKTHAASQNHSSIDLVSFLAVDESLASGDQIATALASLKE